MLGKEIKHDFGKKNIYPGKMVESKSRKFKKIQIGPTSEDLYDAFLKRLFKVFKKILFLDFTLTYLMTTRVIKVLTRNKIKYLVRDGNHIVFIVLLEL